MTPGGVALPWLVLPPALLLVALQVHPVYDGRYVEYCLPSAPSWWRGSRMARQAGRGRNTVAEPQPGGHGEAWLPAAAILVLLVIALIPADAKVSLPSSRPDNLAGYSQIVAANAKPETIAFFIPMSYRPIEVEYPAQWRVFAPSRSHNPRWPQTRSTAPT